MGRTIEKQWLRQSSNEALSLVIDNMKRNWRRHVAEFAAR